MQYREKIIIEPYRGTIYDRHGCPMTENSNEYYSVSINPYNVLDPKRFTRDLASVTGQSSKKLLAKLKRSSRCVVLSRKLNPEQAERLKNMGWNLIIKPETHRRYPHKSIAGQLIGFTDIDNKGISGLELTFDELLRGQPGWRVVQLDVHGRQHIDESYPYKPQRDSGDLVLTIDMSIQSILEEELKPALSYYKGKAANGLIIDPNTGQILAMASLPFFDPNRPGAYPASHQKNTVVTEMYEPGSTFKTIVAALLLEKNLVSPDSMVDCGNGYITLHGKTIHDAHGYGELDFKGVLVKSSNVGIIKLTSDIRRSDLYDQIKNFGFLERTDIELSGESCGSMPAVEDWSGLTRPNVVIGQGIAVTMLQMTMAYAAIANGGWLMKPTLVKELHYPDGDVIINQPQRVRRVIRQETAETLRTFLTAVVESGTGRTVRIENMPIAGKTGTAQMVNHRQGGYYKDRYIASFIGFIPAASPRYLMLISVIDPQGPRGEHTGSNVCGPIFKRVAERIIGFKPELWTSVDSETRAMTSDLVEVPDLRSKGIRNASSELKVLGLKAVKYGTGVVYDQIPAPGSLAMKGGKVHLTLGPINRPKGMTVIMPVLTGLSLRDAVKKATEAGLMVEINGSGKVMKQSPSSGKRVSMGDMCSLSASG